MAILENPDMKSSLLLIVCCFVLCPVKVGAQAVVTCLMDRYENGTFLLTQLSNHDTLARGEFHGHQFVTELQVDVGEDEGVAAMLHIAIDIEDKGRHVVQFIPMVVENMPIEVHVPYEGQVVIQGSATQDMLNRFMTQYLPYVRLGKEDTKKFLGKPVQSAFGQLLDSFFLHTRENKLADLSAYMIADMVSVRGINPKYIHGVQSYGEQRDLIRESEQWLMQVLTVHGRSKMGMPLKILQLFDADGELISIDTLMKGKPYIIYFWASWCVNCQRELPFIHKMWVKYGIDVIGVSVDLNKAAWKKAWRSHNYPWGNYLDPGRTVFYMFNLFAVPTTILVNENGVVVEQNPHNLDSAVRKLMQGKYKIKKKPEGIKYRWKF